MSLEDRVLVVGTTADYIEILDRSFPRRCLFVTLPQERAEWPGLAPDAADEILCELDSFDVVMAELKEHLRERSQQLTGVACYDCESMRLASRIARAFGLPFPSEASILTCRSKILSKQMWRANKVACPPSGIVRSEDDVRAFFASVGHPIVLKPLTGSGGELVFFCSTADEAVANFRILQNKLAHHPDERMYGQQNMAAGHDPQDLIGAERFVGGEEFSCDFILDRGQVTVIRLIKKIHYYFGAVLGYQILKDYEQVGGENDLKSNLKAAAESVGLDRAMAMVDMKVEDGKIYFIEMTPRPGGDCLPPLIKESSGFDTLKAALDFSEGRPLDVTPIAKHKPLVGVHLFAQASGTIRQISARDLVDDDRVILYHLKQSVGDKVRLPPEDYDSRVLGYAVIEPKGRDVRQECLEIMNLLKVEIR